MKLNKPQESADITPDFAASLVDLLFRSCSRSSTRSRTQELPAKEPFWRFWRRCRFTLKYKQLKGIAAAPSGYMARSWTVLCVSKWREENDEQGRELSKQQWNHCCAEAKKLILSSRREAKAGSARLRSSFAFCQSTFKLVFRQGDSACNCIPPDSRLWKKARTSPVCSQSPSRAAGRLSQKRLPSCLGPLRSD